MAVRHYGWLAGDDANQIAQHYGMSALLRPAALIISLIEDRAGVGDDQAKVATKLRGLFSQPVFDLGDFEYPLDEKDFNFVNVKTHLLRQRDPAHANVVGI